MLDRLFKIQKHGRRNDRGRDSRLENHVIKNILFRILPSHEEICRVGGVHNASPL